MSALTATLDWLGSATRHFRKLRIYPPGWPCPSWINDIAGKRRDYFCVFVVALRHDDGSVTCWPIGIGPTFWYIDNQGDWLRIYGKPTTWDVRFMLRKPDRLY
jgi:hypothetical protein